MGTRPSTCVFVKTGLSAHFAPFFSLVSREEFPQVVVVSRDTRVPGFAHLGIVREMLLIQYFICTDIEKGPLPHVWGRGLGAPMGIGHKWACYKRACGGYAPASSQTVSGRHRRLTFLPIRPVRTERKTPVVRVGGLVPLCSEQGDYSRKPHQTHPMRPPIARGLLGQLGHRIAENAPAPWSGRGRCRLSNGVARADDGRRVGRYLVAVILTALDGILK